MLGGDVVGEIVAGGLSDPATRVRGEVPNDAAGAGAPGRKRTRRGGASRPSIEA